MIKKSFGQLMGLTLVAVLLLSACKKDMGQIEPPEVVLNKAITQATKIYEEKMELKMSFSDATKKNSGEINMKASGKNNSKDINNLQSDVDIDGSMNIKADQGEEKGQGKATIAFAGNIKNIGEDIYGSLTQLDLDGDLEGLEEAKATLPVFLTPYMNETVKLPLGELMDLTEEVNKQAQLQGQPPLDYEAMKKYSLEQGPKDVADSKMIVATKDHGIEKVKSLGGKSVQAYHYEIGFDGEGLKTFLKKFNESTQMIPENELQELLKDENSSSFSELTSVLNEAITMHVWIGQTDYQLYKMEVTSDLKNLQAALNKVQELEGASAEDLMSDEEKEFFDKGSFELKITDERSPLNSFNLKKPDDKDVIDLGPMLKLFMNQAVNQMNPGNELQMLDNSGNAGLSEEEMQKMLDSLSTTPAQ